MRLMTIDEQREVLRCLVSAEFWADMSRIDSICYGGNARQFGEQREYAARVIGAFPKDIRDAYDAELRKAKADVLRSKADAIERGAHQ